MMRCYFVILVVVLVVSLAGNAWLIVDKMNLFPSPPSEQTRIVPSQLLGAADTKSQSIADQISLLQQAEKHLRDLTTKYEELLNTTPMTAQQMLQLTKLEMEISVEASMIVNVNSRISDLTKTLLQNSR